MTIEETRTWLNEQWRRALADSSGETDPEFDRFINCNVASLRFAVGDLRARSCYRSVAAGGAGTIWMIVGNRSGSAPAAWR